MGFQTTSKPHFQWEEKPYSPQEGDYVYEKNKEPEYEDEEVRREEGGRERQADDERQRDSRRRTKRQESKRRKAKTQKTKAPKPPSAEGGGAQKARFSDLREAVLKSKEAQGTVDYQGVVSRASVVSSANRFEASGL